MAEKTHGSFYEEREHIILDLLQKKGRITVAETAKLTGLSASTIRLQFQSMHDKGLLLRTHGGAIKADYPQHLNNQSDIFDGIVNLDKNCRLQRLQPRLSTMATLLLSAVVLPLCCWLPKSQTEKI